jgi:hypothetical protein
MSDMSDETTRLDSPAPAPDLQQAIQVADKALSDTYDWSDYDSGWDIARIAVEAAAPVLLQATRDRHADLQAYCAELRETLAELFDLLHVMTLSPKERESVNVRDLQVVEARVRAALQVQGPPQTHRGEVERLRVFHRVARAKILAYQQALTRREHAGVAAGKLADALVDLVEAFGDPALDQGAAQGEDVRRER